MNLQGRVKTFNDLKADAEQDLAQRKGAQETLQKKVDEAANALEAPKAALAQAKEAAQKAYDAVYSAPVTEKREAMIQICERVGSDAKEAEVAMVAASKVDKGTAGNSSDEYLKLKAAADEAQEKLMLSASDLPPAPKPKKTQRVLDAEEKLKDKSLSIPDRDSANDELDAALEEMRLANMTDVDKAVQALVDARGLEAKAKAQADLDLARVRGWLQQADDSEAEWRAMKDREQLMPAKVDADKQVTATPRCYCL